MTIIKEVEHYKSEQSDQQFKPESLKLPFYGSVVLIPMGPVKVISPYLKQNPCPLPRVTDLELKTKTLCYIDLQMHEALQSCDLALLLSAEQLQLLKQILQYAF